MKWEDTVVFHATNKSNFTAEIVNWLQQSPAEISWDAITLRPFFSKAIWQCRHLKMPWPGALGPWEGGHHEDTTLHLAARDIPERGLLLGGWGVCCYRRETSGQLEMKPSWQQPLLVAKTLSHPPAAAGCHGPICYKLPRATKQPSQCPSASPM